MNDFHVVMGRILGDDGHPALSSEDLTGLERLAAADAGPSGRLARVVAALSRLLCGGGDAATANATLEQEAAAGSAAAGLLQRLGQLVHDEQRELAQRSPALADRRRAAAEWARGAPTTTWDSRARQHIWGFLFPEGAACLADPDAVVDALRRRRTVRVTEPNWQPITDPIQEVLVTANVLLSLPHDMARLESLALSPQLRQRVAGVAGEEQQYWFDHPIPVGVSAAANKVLYGLRALDQAVAHEKRKDDTPPEARLACVLSVSVTHAGLQGLARDYLREMLAQSPPLQQLEVYVFTEADTAQLVDEVLGPGAAADGLASLRRGFGVDGKYGRHYNFLKAIAALWQVLVDPRVRATFKSDLDQVFPQDELEAEGGGSAFDHFRSPLWGARGADADGQPVELGMIAGSLVNEQDIGRGLFTPDVPRPASIPSGEAVAFCNRLPMALSTEAEMLTQYSSADEGGAGVTLDGRTTCLQRIHVTGGTNGILVDALRRHRPFVPSFFGRAEDQGYLLSVLFAGSAPLRYLHSAGLVMRHDKEAFAGDAIEAAQVGRFVGDLERTLLYSYYLRALPWDEARIKETIDPFTGCFASDIPATIVALRLVLRVSELLSRRDESAVAEACEIVDSAAGRLAPLLGPPAAVVATLGAAFTEEKDGWQLYYDVLQSLQDAIGVGDQQAIATRERARQLVSRCRVSSHGGS